MTTCLKNILIIGCILLCFHTSIVAQGELFWSDLDLGVISKIDLNTSEPIQVILAESNVDYHATDPTNGKVYWTDRGQLTLVKSNLDGTEKQNLQSNLSNPQGLTLDNNGNIYFIDDTKIIKTTITGGNQSVILSGLSNPTDITFFNDKLYWGDRNENVIEVMNIDGSNRSVLLSDAINPYDVEIDPLNEVIYWLQRTGGIPGSGVFKAALDGSNRGVVIEEFALGIFVDGASSNLYWSNSTSNTIFKTDLNNVSNTEALINDDLPFPKSISIDKANDKIYFTDSRYGGFLYEANLSDGESVTTIGESSVYRPDAIEIDTVNNVLYWINLKSSFNSDTKANIMRSDLNGNNIETLVSYPDIKKSEGLALDVARNHMYWTDQSSRKVMRADMDGTNQIEIVTGLDNPAGLAIDLTNDKLYWGDWGDDLISRADLDGSNVEIVINTDISTPKSIAIDQKGAKLYWTDSATNELKRANLDGSNVELVIDPQGSSNDPNSVFIDEFGGRMYFSVDWGDEKIASAALDGSDVQDLLTNEVDAPGDLFLVSDLSSNNLELTDEVFTIYPNPFDDQLLIEGEFNISKIELFDLQGKCIYAEGKLSTKKHSLQLGHLNPGFYTIKIHTMNQISTEKLIHVGQ